MLVYGILGFEKKKDAGGGRVGLPENQVGVA